MPDSPVVAPRSARAGTGSASGRTTRAGSDPPGGAAGSRVAESGDAAVAAG